MLNVTLTLSQGLQAPKAAGWVLSDLATIRKPGFCGVRRGFRARHWADRPPETAEDFIYAVKNRQETSCGVKSSEGTHLSCPDVDKSARTPRGPTSAVKIKESTVAAAAALELAAGVGIANDRDFYRQIIGCGFVHVDCC